MYCDPEMKFNFRAKAVASQALPSRNETLFKSAGNPYIHTLPLRQEGIKPADPWCEYGPRRQFNIFWEEAATRSAVHSQISVPTEM